MKAFVVLDEGYINQAVVSLSSFFRYNRIELIIYAEKGTDLSRVLAVVPEELVEVRYVTFPQHELFATVGGNRLMVHRSAVPAIAQRIKSLEEVSAETDCVLNFDLDTLFLGSAVPLLEEITAEQKSGIFGVSERENRDKWMKQMKLKEIVNTPLYFNTGLMCYKADCKGLYEKFIKTIEEKGDFMYCPEQDFVNLHFKKKHQLSGEFNAIWFNPGYKEMAPLMVHYLSMEKPWNRFIYLDFRAYAYWQKYLSACERVESYLDREFLERVRSNVRRVK